MTLESRIKYISSDDNPVLRHVKKLLRDRSYRYERGEFVIEGYKVFDSARGIGFIFLRDDSPMPEGDFSEAVVMRVAGRTFDKLPENAGGQGIIAVCPMPPARTVGQGGRYLYLDGLQDPGNTGTLIRTAAAFGLDGVLLGKGCADPFAPKTVRSAAGAVFKIPLIFIRDPKTLEGRRIIAADMKGPPLGEASGLEDFILAVGSEGKGLSGEVRKICTALVSVPMKEGVESLNAAVSAAIILYDLCRPASRGHGP